jgi:hypothetical protein
VHVDIPSGACQSVIPSLLKTGLHVLNVPGSAKLISSKPVAGTAPKKYKRYVLSRGIGVFIAMLSLRNLFVQRKIILQRSLLEAQIGRSTLFWPAEVAILAEAIFPFGRIASS